MATAQQTCTLINGVNVDGLTATIQAVKATPEIAKFRFNIQNKWKEGGQNTSHVNEYFGAGQQQSRPQPFVLEADEPAIVAETVLKASIADHPKLRYAAGGRAGRLQLLRTFAPAGLVDAGIRKNLRLAAA